MKIIGITICSVLFCGYSLSQNPKKIVLDEKDVFSGYYLANEPAKKIEGVLVLLGGFGNRAEDVFPETKLDEVGFKNNILTLAFACGNKLYADSVVRSQLNKLFKDIMQRYKVSSDQFVLGGYSAGGMIVLRYTELCKQFPNEYPIDPKGVFTVDSPIDIFRIWDNLEASAKNKYSEPAVEEAERAMMHVKNDHGIPKEHVNYYSELTAFSMDKSLGENEKYLKTTAVRTYHDVDIPWRLLNRNQTVAESNYLETSELINRLLLMGNKRAEFMQSYKTGYRANGQRHPHSWSIVDEEECISWMKLLLQNK